MEGLKIPDDTIWVIAKTRNDLKQPTTNKKRPETTYNEQETT